MLFRGSGVALITPFDKDNNINYKKIDELIKFHLKNNTDAIIVCGTTGESATLSTEEKKKLIKHVIKKVNKKIPVIAGTGSNNTQAAIEMSKYAESVGADGLLIVTPYYNKCTQEGLYKHYEKIASSTTLPIILYNVPGRTAVNISVDTVLKLSKIKNIVGIKEASSDITQISNILSQVDDDFYVYSGNDDQILPILSLGGSGVISVLANIYPKEVHDLCQNFFDNNLENAKRLQFRFLDLIKSLFIEVNPIPVKEAMNILKYDVGSCRLPLSKMSTKNKKILKSSLDKLNN